ncbi:hypothetical protein ACH347_31550 [Saccharopolyspora sp. 5N102]|uniref:hypothetical protein n=1 Tax=Saccharopolyspora sp. 5N102 TaxID=3375155 RepID=UPI0037977149
MRLTPHPEKPPKAISSERRADLARGLGGANPVPQFQWKLRPFGASGHDTPKAVDNSRNFNGNRIFDFH